MNTRFALGALVAVSGVFMSSGCQSSGQKTAAEPRLVTVVMSTTAGDIEIELDGTRAPITVENFLMYASRGSYDGCIFHRVVGGFVVQGGGYGPPPALENRAKADEAKGKPDKPIVNEWERALKNERGTIGMARDTDPNSATREFYINLADNAKLDIARPDRGNAGYCAFGRVVRGMDVVDRIGAAKVHAVPGNEELQSLPDQPVTITNVRIAGR